MSASKSCLFVLMSIFTLLSSSSFSLVYWQEDWNKIDGPPTNLETPDPNCMAKINWSGSSLTGGSKTSCVIIGPNLMMTAAHWGGYTAFIPIDTPPKKVSRGVEESYNYVIADVRLGEPGLIPIPDLAICLVKKIIDPVNGVPPTGYDCVEDPNDLLEDANFDNWIDLYETHEEFGKEITVGSYGRQWIYPNWNYNDPFYHNWEVDAGTLHWGKNTISQFDDYGLYKIMSAVGIGDYVEYECEGGYGCSGSPWFLKDGVEWKVASLYTGQTFGPRISSNIGWIYNKIIDLVPFERSIVWEGSIDNDWGNSANWDVSNVPSLNDVVAIDATPNVEINGGLNEADQLFLGIENEAVIDHNSGDLNITGNLYIGDRTDSNGIYNLDSANLCTQYLYLGSGDGVGHLNLQDSESSVTAREIVFGKNSYFSCVSGGTMTIDTEDITNKAYDGAFKILPEAPANNLNGLGQLTLQCVYPILSPYNESRIISIEVAGIDVTDPNINDFCTDNFVVDELIVGHDKADVNDFTGRIGISLVDNFINQDGSVCEALYVNNLEIKAGATFETSYQLCPPCNLYYRNGSTPKLFLMGDVNLNGVVDQNDLDIWEMNKTIAGAEWADGDINGDRMVDNLDKAIIESAFKSATNPVPENDARMVNYPFNLSWTSGITAVSHNVYFGDSIQDIFDANEFSTEFIGNQTENFYVPNDLEFGVTYYWRIDEVDPNDHIIRGPVWTFSYMPKRVKIVRTNDYYTFIQDAIDCSINNDIIEVAQGVYNENLRLEDIAVTIRSKEPLDWDIIANTIIEGNGSTLPVIDVISSDSIFSGLTIRGSSFFGLRGSCSDTKIKYCIITEAMCGIYFYLSDIQVNNCKIFENDESGIILEDDCSDTVISNNLIYKNGLGTSGYGGIASDSYGVIIKNNTIYGNLSGIYWDGGSPEITNCIIYGNGDDLVDCDATYSCVSDLTENPGVGNIDSDPLFYNVDANDFHLTYLSPCFDTGDPNYTADPNETDIDGEYREPNGRIDMGADEAGCIAYNASEHADWVAWGRPECWCYRKQCRGDINGQSILGKPVTLIDLDILKDAYNKTDAELELVPNGICADLNHASIIGKRVTLTDLNILKMYYFVSDPNVPQCDNTDINFWTN